jgi:LmbE family N-acetylglucosaminyl deacetylase
VARFGASLEGLHANEGGSVSESSTSSAPGAAADPPEPMEPKRALVVAGHPDDSEFGCGGTAALWSREGWEFYYLVCTDGSKGSADPDMPPEKLVPLRREEQRAAARRLGVKDVFFLGYADGELTRSRELLGDVVRHIRRLKPYAVFTHDPEAIIIGDSFVNHSDHRTAGMVAIDAVYPAARDRWNFPEHIEEGLEPHNVKEIYIWGSERANFIVDITDVVDTKIEALLEHKTQFGDRPEFLDFVRERWRGEDGRYKERFRRVVMFR